MAFTVVLSGWLVLAGAHPYLEEGERLYEAQAWEKAVARLTMATGVPELSVVERRLTFDLLARCQVALGRIDLAEEAFAALLGRDPSAPMPRAAPKVRDAFGRAKQRLYAPDHVKLRGIAAPVGHVRIELIDPWGLTREVALMEAGAEGKFSQSVLGADGGQFTGPLLAGTERYFVRALGEDRRVLASLGNEGAPLKTAVQPASARAISAERVAPTQPRSRLPVWVAGAVSAAALATGVALAVAASGDSRRAGEAVFSSDRKALDDSARDKAVAANVLVGVGIVGGGATVVLAWVW